MTPGAQATAAAWALIDSFTHSLIHSLSHSFIQSRLTS
jgi:hypothetical protein